MLPTQTVQAVLRLWYQNVKWTGDLKREGDIVNTV